MSGVVIKAGDARALGRGMFSLDLRDIGRRADAMLSAARAEADQIVAAAREEAEAQRDAVRRAAHRSGYEKGLAEGKAAGEEAGLAEVRARFARDQVSLVSSLTGLLDAFSAQREQMYLAARRDVVVLSVAIARRILKQQGEDGEVACEAAVAACAEALELLSEATEAVVRAHPGDWAAVEELAETVADSAGSSRHIRVVQDASVGRGGVIVETANSRIDATAAARVERIADEVVDDWRGRMKALSLES